MHFSGCIQCYLRYHLFQVTFYELKFSSAINCVQTIITLIWVMALVSTYSDPIIASTSNGHLKKPKVRSCTYRNFFSGFTLYLELNLNPQQGFHVSTPVYFSRLTQTISQLDWHRNVQVPFFSAWSNPHSFLAQMFFGFCYFCPGSYNSFCKFFLFLF